MFLKNGGNEGGFLTIVNAETLKLETAFGDELKSQVSWPTHVAVLGDDNIYLRDNGGIKLFILLQEKRLLSKERKEPEKIRWQLLEEKFLLRKTRIFLS